MGDYTPKIQERFRRKKFPIERIETVDRLRLTTQGIDSTRENQWQYRTQDERSNVILTEHSFAAQTTSYDRFESFVDQMMPLFKDVMEVTEHIEHGLVSRVGLRYVDLIQPRDDESFRDYLKDGLHGLTSDALEEQTHFLENMGRTQVGAERGVFALRVHQNRQGQDFPPDLRVAVPKFDQRSHPGELVTIVDMDHWVEGNRNVDIPTLTETLFRLHDHIIETFFNRVISQHALEVWK